MDAKRCLFIANAIKDNLLAIRVELINDYQSADYLLSKLKPIIYDINVLKNEFEYLQKEQKLKEGEQK